MLIASVLLVAICLLSGCDKIQHGKIYKKEFVKKSVRISPIPSGKTVVLMTTHYPDRWKIYIRSLKKNEQGEYETAVYYTKEKYYNNCKIGDVFTYKEGRDSVDEPVGK